MDDLLLFPDSIQKRCMCFFKMEVFRVQFFTDNARGFRLNVLKFRSQIGFYMEVKIWFLFYFECFVPALNRNGVR